MNRLSKTFAVATLGLLMCLCTVGGTAWAKSSKDALKVGIVAVNYNSPTIHRMADVAMKEAKKRGWKPEFFDGQGDQVATNNAANNFISRGFDAIINIASPNPQMKSVIENAKKHGVVYVSTFSGLAPDIGADIGSNNTADGVISATEMVGRLGGRGNVVKLNWTVLPALKERDNGFHAVLKDYPNIHVKEIEVKVPGQVDDAYNQITNLLTSGEKIDAVWVGWDEIAIPVVRAIEQAHMQDKIFVVSMDGIQPVFDLIRKGGPMALTVAYDVDGMGKRAVRMVAQLIDGHPPASRLVTLKPCLITKATVPPQGEKPDFDNCVLFSGEM